MAESQVVVRFRNLPAILPGRHDCFTADPRLLVVDEDYNCRDMQSAETLAHIDWLAEEIESQGYNPEMPLTVKRRADDMVVIRGHCRLAACLKLIAKGVELIGIPVMQIASGTSDVDLIFDQESSNSGLRLDPLAKPRLCRKAQRAGVTDEEIARRMHWKDVSSVARHLEMLEVLPETVKHQVSAGDISATEATKLVKNLPKGTDPVEAAKIIAANKEENRRLGVGKRTNHKVTAKTLNRGKKKDAPERKAAIPVDAKAIERADSPTTAISGVPEDRVDQDSRSENGVAQHDRMTEEELLKGLEVYSPPTEKRRSTEGATETIAAGWQNDKGGRNDEPSQVTERPPPPPPSRSSNATVKMLIEVIAPIKNIFPDIDPDSPNDKIVLVSDFGHEINAGQIRAIWKTVDVITGGSDV